MSYINHFNERDIETMHPMVEGEVLVYFFNCHEDSIQAVLKKPMARDFAEFSFSQNLLDNNGFPDYEVIDSGLIDRIKAMPEASSFS